ncbi:MAG: hypothetical protein COA77_03685 [Thaumarchaeota archaeon]|nr:MAG: hypothetical protein COA77_03685 [Nitrososphaerota archaeon]
MPTRLNYECQPDSPITFNQIPTTTVTRLNYECQPDSVISFDHFLDTIISSPIFQSYALSENTLENPPDDFFTLERFLKEDPSIHSLEQLITSEKELALEIIKNYFQKYDTAHKPLESTQLILFVVILASIFGQQFGGNRNLPVA